MAAPFAKLVWGQNLRETLTPAADDRSVALRTLFRRPFIDLPVISTKALCNKPLGLTRGVFPDCEPEKPVSGTGQLKLNLRSQTVGLANSSSVMAKDT